MARSNVSEIDFARSYNSSETVAEVAAKTGLSSAAVNSRSANYRKKGVHLKRLLGRGRHSINVAAINQMLCDEGLVPAGIFDSQGYGGATAEANGAPLIDILTDDRVPMEDQAPAKPKRKRKR